MRKSGQRIRPQHRHPMPQECGRSRSCMRSAGQGENEAEGGVTLLGTWPGSSAGAGEADNSWAGGSRHLVSTGLFRSCKAVLSTKTRRSTSLHPQTSLIPKYYQPQAKVLQAQGQLREKAGASVDEQVNKCAEGKGPQRAWRPRGEIPAACCF
jgi:hypothetical protein